MPSQTTKQQRGVLLIALLGIRRMNRNPKPTRQEVLNFINRKMLIAWNEHEIDLSDSNCSVGENRISWRRKDFVMADLLKHAPSKASWPANWHLLGPNRTEYGIWELTDAGLAKAEKIVTDWEQRFEEHSQFFDELRLTVPELKLTDEFMNLVLQLAHNDFKTKFFPKPG
jgi:hypothetical protein